MAPHISGDQRHGTCAADTASRAYQGSNVGVVRGVPGDEVLQVELAGSERLLRAGNEGCLLDGSLEVAWLGCRCPQAVHDAKDGSAVLENRVAAIPDVIAAPLGGLAWAREGHNMRLGSSLQHADMVQAHDDHIPQRGD